MNKAEPLVWIVVLHWGKADDTLACLESLRASAYSNRQTVLIDNGAHHDLRQSVRQHFPDVHLLENGRNLGYAEGNNVGLRFALAREADYILLVNNDTAVPPVALTLLVGAASADNRIGMACPAVVSFFDRSRRFEPGINWEMGLAGEHALPPEQYASRDVDYAAGCALLVKAEVVRSIGLLDPAFFAYYEDVDWSLRCKRAGFRVVIVPSAEIFHKGTPDQTSHRSANLWYYYLRNQALFMRRYTPRRERPVRLRRYTRACLEEYSAALRVGSETEAAAILDGWWAGLLGRTGPQRLAMPPVVRSLIRRHLRRAL